MKRRKKYKLKIAGPHGEIVAEVKAEPVKVEGFDKLHLFIHPSCEDSNKWTVTEANSGAAIATKESSSEKAIKVATKRLKEVGQDEVLKTIYKTLKEYGIKNEI